jgi:hypothetical protein
MLFKTRKFIFDRNKFITFEQKLLNFFNKNFLNKKFCDKISLNEKEEEKFINNMDNNNDNNYYKNNLIIKEKEKSQLEILEKKANRK